MSEQVIVEDEIVTVVSVGEQGPPGPGLADTDDLAEGSANKYFTDSRARAATVADAITDGITNIAPSQNAVFDALVGKSNTGHNHDDRYYTETETDALLSGKANSSHSHAQSDITGLSASLAAKEDAANKGQAGGYASLDGTGKVPAAQLPSYVDDVLDYDNLGAFPALGSTGVIYVAKDTNKTYRWSGTVYVEISPSPGSTDAVPEGSTNLYFTTSRAAAAAPVQSVAGQTGAVVLTKSDVGLSNVDNTSDANKPVSTAQQAALDLKAPLSSPALTGTPTAPTAAPSTNTTQVATTAFVQIAVANLINSAPGALDTLWGSRSRPEPMTCGGEQPRMIAG